MFINYILYFLGGGGAGLLHADFKYKKGGDSVLVVKKEDCDSCNTNNPKQKMDDGDSTFKLSDSGLFFFISGNADHCKNGQKLIVLVMAPRRHPLPPTAAPPSQSPASGSLVPPEIHSSALVSPAPSPSDASGLASSVGVGVGFGIGVWVVFILTGFTGFV